MVLNTQLPCIRWTYPLIRLIHGQAKSQKCTFCLVTQLFWKTTFLFWLLKEGLTRTLWGKTSAVVMLGFFKTSLSLWMNYFVKCQFCKDNIWCLHIITKTLGLCWKQFSFYKETKIALKTFHFNKESRTVWKSFHPP